MAKKLAQGSTRKQPLSKCQVNAADSGRLKPSKQRITTMSREASGRSYPSESLSTYSARDGRKVVGVMMVKNEADIIEASVTNNLRFCDSLRILDNGSQDETGSILRRLAGENWPIVLSQDNRLGYNQAQKVTALYHLAADQDGADFVIPLDADEFIQAQDRDTFLEALASIPEQGIGYWNWQNHLPWDLNSMEIASRFSRYQQSEITKVIIRVPPPHLRRKDFILQGSHKLFRPHVTPPAIFLPFDRIYLAHFPVRSIQQVVSKALAGWMAIKVVSSNLGGVHWKTLCEEILAGKNFDRDWLIWQAVDYGSRDLACSPPPEGAEAHALALSQPANLLLASPNLALQGPEGERIDWQAISRVLFRTWEQSLEQGCGAGSRSDRSPWSGRLRHLWHRLRQ